MTKEHRLTVYAQHVFTTSSENGNDRQNTETIVRKRIHAIVRTHFQLTPLIPCAIPPTKKSWWGNNQVLASVTDLFFQ